MWHLFGPIIRWPLHSPLRLLGVIAAAVVAVTLLGVINDDGAPAASDAPAATPGPVDRAVVPTPVPAPTTAADGGAGTAGSPTGGTDAFSEDPAAVDPGAAAQQAAAEFVAAWARPDLDAPTWQAGLAERATPELSQALADTDPANLPAVTVAGAPVQVAANAEAGVYDVPTTGDFVRVHVQLIDGRWLATDVEPAA